MTFQLRNRLLIFIILLAPFFVDAQIIEAGFHFGLNSTSLKLDQNKLSEEVILRKGRTSLSPNFGIQLMVGPPRKQSSTRLRIIPSALFEASLCRCINSLNLFLTNPNGTRSFDELKYLIYRGDFSGKFVATIKRFQFMLGPTITTNMYAGVRIGGNNGLQYAGDQFRNVVAGYEIGVGKKFNTIMISARYHGLLETYGQKTDLFPTEFRNSQFRFMLSYFFLKKEKGMNWNSIYWK